MNQIWTARVAGAALALGATPCLAQTPVGFVNMVVVGNPDPANVVPQFNIAPNSQVNNLSIAVPRSLLTRGNTYIYWVSFQDISFTGTCTVSYQIASGQTVLQTGQILQFKCQPGVYGAGIAAGVPSTAGSYTLTGEVAFGKKKVKLSAPVVVQ